MAIQGLNYNRISAEQYVRAAGDYAGVLVIRENNAEQIAGAIKTSLAAALEEVGLAAEGFAKKKLTENHSVDTGRLRNSVTHAIDMGGEAVYIGTNVEYAPYVELGTSRSEEKPYLRPAAQDHAREYRVIIEKHLKNA
jgi:HK97 gp10 family phage protein